MCGDARPDLAGPVRSSARLTIFPASLSVGRAAPLPDFLAPKLHGGGSAVAFSVLLCNAFAGRSLGRVGRRQWRRTWACLRWRRFAVFPARGQQSDWARSGSLTGSLTRGAFLAFSMTRDRISRSWGAALLRDDLRRRALCGFFAARGGTRLPSRSLRGAFIGTYSVHSCARTSFTVA